MAAPKPTAPTIASIQNKQDYGIRTDYQPTDEEHDKIKWVYDRYNAMRFADDRIKAEKDWDKWERQWEGWREPRKQDDWQSNHVVPLTTGVIESALAEFVDQNLRPLILPRNSEDKPKAQVMSYMYDFTWDVADGDLELFNIERDTLMLGTGIGQEFYWKDRRICKILNGTDKQDNPIYDDVEVLDYDDPYLECVKLQDFFVDERARGFTGPYGARDAIRRYIMDIDDFKLFFSGPVWDHLGNAKFVKPGGDTNYYEFYQPPSGINHDREVEVLWYWGKKPEDALFIVANDVPVVLGPNPYKHKQLPFVRAVDIKRSHRFYGKGEAEILESVQDEINTIRRMMIDRNHLDIDKMFTGSNRLDLDDSDLIARPHGFIPSDDPSGLRPIEYGDIPRSVELGKDWLQEDAIRVTGIDDRSQANQPGSTATSAALVKETYLKRIRMKMRIVEQETLINVARLRVSNILQFYSVPDIQEVIGIQNSQKFANEILELKQKGQLYMEDGRPYKVQYRQIRTDGKKVMFDATGQPQTKSERGYHFFDARPEYFTPSAKGGFDFKFAAGASLPLSKPLQQTKATEMFDRLSVLALNKIGYDPVKLGDMLLEVNDYNPDDYHLDQPGSSTTEQGVTDQRATMLIQLAQTENSQMIKGKAVPPTPYATPAHTMIHVSFMHGDQFQALPPDSPIIKIFTNHVVGEMTAQKMRQQAGTVAPAGSTAGGGTDQPQPGQPDQPMSPDQGQAAQAGLNQAQQMPNNQASQLQAITPQLKKGGEQGIVH